MKPTHSHSFPSYEQPTMDEKDEPSRTLVFLTVSFYLVAALVMVFVNKWVLNSVSVPIFLLWCQLVIAVLLLQISSSLGFLKLPKNILKNVFSSTNQFKLLRSILPLVLINTLGLIFNTYCLKFVEASFYQVARGLILPFTVLASYLFLGTETSLKINISTLIVCLGFMVGVSSERFTVSYLGVMLGILSSITTSMHSIIVKKSLEKVPSTISLTYYSNALSALLVFPLILILGELPTIFILFTSGFDQFKTFFFGTLVTGLFGFLICIAGFLSIKVTSPVTHMISSAVRGVIQTGLGATLFGDQITTGRITGIVVILMGSIYYTWVKDQELSDKKSRKDNHVAMKKVNAEQSESLILQVNDDGDNDGQYDRLENDEDYPHNQLDLKQDPNRKKLSPISPYTPSSSLGSNPSFKPNHHALDDNQNDNIDDDDDDDDDNHALDDDLKELKRAEKALGL